MSGCGVYILIYVFLKHLRTCCNRTLVSDMIICMMHPDMKQSYCSHPEIDSFLITAHPEVSYSSAICQHCTNDVMEKSVNMS